MGAGVAGAGVAGAVAARAECVVGFCGTVRANINTAEDTQYLCIIPKIVWASRIPESVLGTSGPVGCNLRTALLNIITLKESIFLTHS